MLSVHGSPARALLVLLELVRQRLIRALLVLLELVRPQTFDMSSTRTAGAREASNV